MIFLVTIFHFMQKKVGVKKWAHFPDYVPLTHKKIQCFGTSSQYSRLAYGNKRLRSFGPHIWNSLLEKINGTTSISVFKNFIKCWFGPKCKCKVLSILSRSLSIYNLDILVLKGEGLRFDTF